MALRSREIPPQLAAPPAARVRLPATPVCWGLTAVCVGLYLWDQLRGGALKEGLLLYGPAVQSGEWWRVFTSDLVHEGPLHLVFNLSVVWTLGRALEAGIGVYRFAVTTLAGALGAGFAVLALNFGQPTLGISGVVLGWAGALVVIAPRADRKQLGIWLVQVLVISLMPRVSFAGHLGGFVFGLACGGAMRLGPRLFAQLAPVIVFAAAALTYLAGSGRFTLGAP